MPEANAAPVEPASNPQTAQGGSGQAPAGSEVPAQPAAGNAASEAPKASGTILDPTDAGEVTAPPDWPEDWRLKMAGGDEKAAKALERFKSPNEVAKSWQEATNKIRSAPKAVVLSEGASEEEIAEFRKAHGIPDKPGDYEIKLPEGVPAFEEYEKPILDSFLASAHKANIPARYVNEMAGWYSAFAAEQAVQAVAAAKEQRVETMNELTREFGAEARPNLQALGNWLDNLPSGIGEMLVEARGPDGLPLVNDVRVAKWMIGRALDENPAANFVAGDGSGKAMATRKAEIEKAMKADMNAYWKDPAMQQEYADILAREERASKKS